MTLPNLTNSAASTTHLLWAGRWIEVVRVPHPLDGWAWQFKSGKDAADWLRS